MFELGVGESFGTCGAICFAIAPYGLIEHVDAIVTNNETIDVNFVCYTTTQIEDTYKPASKPLSVQNESSTRQHSGPVGHTRNISKGLRGLLRLLMHTDSFSTSDILINTGGKYPYKAKNLFLNFEDITEQHVDRRLRGYWGVIGGADSDIQWLNTANDKDVSIPLSDIQPYFNV